MFEECQVAGTPIFIVKAYLPVNESFGKNIITKLSLYILVFIFCHFINNGMPVQPFRLGA